MLALTGLFSIGLLALTVFRAATHALPLFVGVSVGFTAARLGAGVPAAFGLGVLAGVLVSAVAQRLASAPVGGWPVALLFSTAAAVAGFQASVALAELTGTAGAWAISAGLAGALATAATAWTRLRGRTA